MIDAAGKFLIPGLWDMHVHTRDESMLALYVANGVTGVRDMNGAVPDLLAWRREVADGRRVGPRMVVASRQVDGPAPLHPSQVRVTTEEETRAAVRAAKADGFDCVKVYDRVPRDLYLALVDEAKRQGLPVVGHVPHAVPAGEASDAGQRTIEHLTGVLLASSADEGKLRRELVEVTKGGVSGGSPLARRIALKELDTFDARKFERLAGRFARNDTWHVPTLVVRHGRATLDEADLGLDSRAKYLVPRLRPVLDPKYVRENHPVMKGYTREDYAHERRVFEKYRELVGGLRKAGVGLLAGTDTPNPGCLPGFGLHDELALLVEAGLTPMDALQAATLNPARCLGREKDLGTVEVGKVADLVLLEADPLADVRNTRKIAAVVLGGDYLSRDRLDGMLAAVERAAIRK